jgi:hypothetical protein
MVILIMGHECEILGGKKRILRGEEYGVCYTYASEDSIMNPQTLKGGSKYNVHMCGISTLKFPHIINV